MPWSIRKTQRKNSNQRGYTYQWGKARRLFLSDHPLCSECLRQGRTTAATVVDHVIPHRGNQRLFWDRHNWQSMCEHCHNRKTASGG